MAKAATVKDVLYALQFASETLCRWPQMSARLAAWSLEPSGMKVPNHVAEEAMAHGGIAGVRHPRAAAAYRWLEAA